MTLCRPTGGPARRVDVESSTFKSSMFKFRDSVKVEPGTLNLELRFVINSIVYPS
jgi:hypothetical protein